MNLRTFSVDPNCTVTQCVGEIPEAIIKYYALSCPSRDVLMFPGVIKHIKKNHADTFTLHYHKIPEIICNPDYVGRNPTSHSVEFYKFIAVDLLVAINLDPSGYFYLSTFYDLNNAQKKIQKRLNSGRIVPFSSIS
jgi:phage-Barnase-EndoU-ColicinE5/D-RelE like nuclease3